MYKTGLYEKTLIQKAYCIVNSSWLDCVDIFMNAPGGRGEKMNQSTA